MNRSLIINSIPFSPSKLDFSHFLIKEIGSIIKGGKDFLDVGCGRLFFYDLLLQINAKGNYIGVDLEPRGTINPLSKLSSKVVKTDFLKFSSPKKFDIIACLWVLEHIKSDKVVLNRAAHFLKRGGYLILAIPSIWSWPFEFGRHGYHYYSKNQIVRYIEEVGLKIEYFYESAGFFGFLFMIVYNWSRFLILVVSLPIFFTFSIFGIYRKSWKDFSKSLISSTLYRYHRLKFCIVVHNYIVRALVTIDNLFKLLPASYVIIVKK